MKVRTQDLIDTALDWAVAKCEGFKYELYEHNRKKWENVLHRPQRWQPSTDRAQGVSIIEREKIETYWHTAMDMWAARHDDNLRYGATPLIAAMRCYVASKLGDEVDIPDELA